MEWIERKYDQIEWLLDGITLNEIWQKNKQNKTFKFTFKGE